MFRYVDPKGLSEFGYLPYNPQTMLGIAGSYILHGLTVPVAKYMVAP